MILIIQKKHVIKSQETYCEKLKKKKAKIRADAKWGCEKMNHFID